MTPSPAVAGALLLAVLTADRAYPDPARPRVLCGEEGSCKVSRLPPVLSDPEVMGYVTSGLTTTLLLTLSTRDERRTVRRRSARIELRFEPWEEVLHVRMAAQEGRPTRQQVPKSGMEAWWRDLAVSFPGPAVAGGGAEVGIDVIPFSEEDEADARRWYAESLRRDSRADAGAAGGGAFAPVLDALTLSSIKRHGVVRFSWTTSVERAP